MKKLAIFVEGQTEKIFVKKFIEQIAGIKNVKFDCKNLTGGVFITLKEKPNDAIVDPKYFILLVNCQNDEKVKSVVLEQRDSLASKGYSIILGLRDLYPKPHSELDNVKKKLQYRVPTTGVATHILLAVAEVEAWFLQEYLHYEQIHPDLDIASFKTTYGFDPVTECAEALPHPSELLHQIYGSVGFAYKKKRKQVERTVRVLDYSNLYLALPNKVPHLSEFVTHIELFLS